MNHANKIDYSDSYPVLIKKMFTREKYMFLKRHGYVVVDGVADQDFCDRIYRSMIDYYRTWNSALDTDDPSTWTSSNLPTGTIHGIDRISGQLQFQWDVRQHPSVVQCFVDYWSLVRRTDYSPEDMVVSMDSFNFYHMGTVPRSHTRRWHHTDQGRPSEDGSEPLDGYCLQGYLNLVDSTSPNDGALIVWDGANRAWRGYWDMYPDEKDHENWYIYPTEYISEIQKDGRRYLQSTDRLLTYDREIPMRCTRVGAKQGSMVFWYSKTPHENCSPSYTRQQYPVHDRAVVYVCMCPKEYLTERDISRRRKAFYEKRQTNHWPAGGQVKLFPKTPRIYSKEMGRAYTEGRNRLEQSDLWTDPVLTDLGRSLLGIDD